MVPGSLGWWVERKGLVPVFRYEAGLCTDEDGIEGFNSWPFFFTPAMASSPN